MMEQDEEEDKVCIVFLSWLAIAPASGPLLQALSIGFEGMMGEE